MTEDLKSVTFFEYLQKIGKMGITWRGANLQRVYSQANDRHMSCMALEEPSLQLISNIIAFSVSCP